MSLTLFQLPTDVPFTYCRICGAYYSHPDARLRRSWSFRHSRTHSYKQHDLLRKSGLWLLPDAAYRLASLGVIPLADLVLDDEIEAAMRESKPLDIRPPPVRSAWFL